METRTINGEVYTLVQRQKSGVGIYRTPHTYLRIGDPAAIGKQLRAHRHLESAGFPVAKLIADGSVGMDAYFIEASLGEHRFLSIFEEDTRVLGHASDAHFEHLMEICERFLDAQIVSPVQRDESAFAEAIHLEILCAELPLCANKLRSRFEESMTRLAAYPFVTTHGDFNPANIYPNGIIDFEDTSCGPLGYDLACVTATAEWFPVTGDYEFLARYIFTEQQKERYVSRFDEIFTEHVERSFAGAFSEFEFLRSVWLTARMHEWPKLQKYRYELFIQKYLS